jgi:SAM-dependent methyltransferase
VTRSVLRQLLGRLSGDVPTPPKSLWAHAGSFTDSANRDLRKLIDEAGLLPHHRVLDVGCGVGRLALALKGYLDRNGSYEGFDVREKAIHWARRRIAGRDQRIGFRHIDVFNRYANPAGSISASEFRFPYDDGSFDLVVLFSVFTHLVTEDMRHYLSEVVRVLAPGARCVATFRLMDRPELVKTADATYDYRHDFGEFLAAHPTVPEQAIAYREDFMRHAYAAAGLEVSKVIYGSRPPNSGQARGQDTVIAHKR